ncbi:MAG: NAD(P)-dependent alcohol dehydrogenase [Anaerolineales bacterium]|nr:NAD(P)-dependent alcohol dehydrogenase [Anaerolineales bacterium]
MKAAVYTEFGPPEVFRIKEVAKPIPDTNEVLIKIFATTVAKEDPDMRNAPGINGLTKPKKTILGMYLAGIVESTGEGVSRFQVGDQVYGSAALKLGAYAEYICLPEDAALVIKPENISFQQAAAVPNGAITTVPFLVHLGKIKNGDKVLITGASGTVGTSAVQLAKYYGAEVTGVCSPTKIDVIRSLGADHVLDYTHEDFTQNGQTYDIIFDTVGKSSYSRSKGSLKPKGVYLTTVPTLEVIPHLLNPFRNLTRSAKFAATALRKTSKKLIDLAIINQIIEKGKYLPVIDRTYTLEEISLAHKYVEEGHKTGDVVITLDAS